VNATSHGVWQILSLCGSSFRSGSTKRRRTTLRSRAHGRLIDAENHQGIFSWVLERLAQAGLIKGKTIGVDSTTLEANAANGVLLIAADVRRASKRCRFDGQRRSERAGKHRDTPDCIFQVIKQNKGYGSSNIHSRCRSRRFHRRRFV
jgi:hypothetical protein